MLLRFILPALAAIGILAAVAFTIYYGGSKNAAPSQLSAPPSTPYKKTVSGTGLVEANTRNIAIGSEQSGVVYNVYVKEGQTVNAGDPLFRIDDEAILASIAEERQAVAVAESQIKVREAELADNADQLKRAEGLQLGSSISRDALQRKRFAVRIAEATLALTKAQKMEAEAKLVSARVDLSKHTITAPVSGRIFKINIRVGEYLNLLQSNLTPILMGNDKPLHLRVQIDENDLWRYSAEAPAEASLRSNKELHFPLKFVRVEPYVQPKRDLSGDTSERIDTRVLEVVYSFNPGDKPVFVGQQMDVFIEAKQ